MLCYYAFHVSDGSFILSTLCINVLWVIRAGVRWIHICAPGMSNLCHVFYRTNQPTETILERDYAECMRTDIRKQYARVRSRF